MSGRPELNEKQKQKLVQFRENLKDILEPKHDDYYLARFLRARNYDLAKSEEMVRNCLTWRKKMKVDTIQQDFKLPEVADKYWAGGILEGFDKEDLPIWIVPIGNFDPKGLLHSMKHGDILRVVLLVLEHQYEEFEKRTKELGKRIGQLTLIVDLENLGLQHLWKPGVELFTQVGIMLEANYPDTLKHIFVVRSGPLFPVFFEIAKPFIREYTRRKIHVLGSLLHSMKHGDILRVVLLVLEHQYEEFEKRTKEVLAVMEKNYPDTLRRVFIVRAPVIFPVAYTLVKPFLQPYTRRKLQVLGSNWREVLHQYIDKDVLPEYWGGTKKDSDGDPKCSSLIKQGGEIPESYYKTEIDVTQKGMITKDISRAGALELKYEVHKPSSILRYTFKTYGNDIGFGVSRSDNSSKKPIVVMENKRYNSHMVPEDGEVILEQPGTYTVKFDNTYSWTKGKAVSYLLEVLEPTDEEPSFVEQTAQLDLNQ